MPKFIDLSGQKFGEITVIKKDIELSKQKRRVYWKCKCSCGREKSIRGDGLKNIKTCGQCANDLSGQKFGRLTVLERGKNDDNGHAYWICKCDCGNICEKSADNLKRGLTQSCGCLHSETTHQRTFIDLTNQRFGKLTVLKVDKIEDGVVFWKCKCDCGNETIVRRPNLVSGHTQSCGCITSSIGEMHLENILQLNNINYIKEYRFNDLQNRRYDFYLPDINRLIEFDGIQHFTLMNTWHNSEEEFKKLQERDNEKNQYAISNNIPLVRIPYWERDKITLDMILGDKYLINNQQENTNNETSN